MKVNKISLVLGLAAIILCVCGKPKADSVNPPENRIYVEYKLDQSGKNCFAVFAHSIAHVPMENCK